MVAATEITFTKKLPAAHPVLGRVLWSSTSGVHNPEY